MRYRVEPFLNAAKKHFSTPGSLPDIGCGGNLPLKTFRDLGWKVDVVAPSEAVAKSLKEDMDINVVSTQVEETTPAEKEDIIISLINAIGSGYAGLREISK